MKWKRFTLLELLVVIVILTILAALLLPALMRAKALARDATCKNNLRQIGLFETLYADEFGVYPFRGISWAGHGGTLSNWAMAIWQAGYAPEWSIAVSPLYQPAKQKASLYCPELWNVTRAHPLAPPLDERGAGGYCYTYATVKGNGDWRGVFGTSANIFGGWNDPDLTSDVYTPPSRVQKPEKVAALIDFGNKFHADNSSGWSGKNYLIPHLGRLNVLYADSHVDGKRRDDFFPPFQGTWGDNNPISNYPQWTREVWDVRY